MRRTGLKLSLHVVVLLCTVAAVLTHGEFVLWRSGVFCHAYSLLYLVLFLFPLLAWGLTRWEHWLHVPGVVVMLVGFYVTCNLTPVMNSRGETLASFDARMGAVRQGWTREQVLQHCGEPVPYLRESHHEGETWVYKWLGATGKKGDWVVWGDGCQYRITFDAAGQVRGVSRNEYGWDTMGMMIRPPLWWPVVIWGPVVVGGLALATLTALCLTRPGKRP